MHKISWSYNPKIAVTTLVWANPRSLATTYGITFVFFSSAYLDVSVQRVCPPIGVIHLQCIGLPHSGTYGSIGVCPSPQLFAAYHAFLRLWEPRHPPYALILLIVLLLGTGSWVINTGLNQNLKPNSQHPIVFFLLFKYFLIPICQWTVNYKLTAVSCQIAWWRITESNRWPPACKAGALASWANPPCFSCLLSVLCWQYIDKGNSQRMTQLLKFP